MGGEITHFDKYRHHYEDLVQAVGEALTLDKIFTFPFEGQKA